jgi:two-component system response regulator FixJ
MVDNRRVYVVDDDTDARASLTFFLNNAGFIARPSSSGVAFLDDVAAFHPGCILLDMRMPGLDGFEVIEALGDLISQFAIIIMTGHGDITTAVRAMKLGAVDFLEKPFADDLLMATLENGFQTLEAGKSQRERQVAAAARLNKLTPREKDVLHGLAAGLSNKVIAFRMQLSVRTVEMYRASMMDRLAVKSLPEAMRLAFIVGMLDHEQQAAAMAHSGDARR